MLHLIASGAYSTRLSKFDLVPVFNHNTNMENIVYQRVTDSPLIKFISSPKGAYYEAKIDLEDLDSSKYRNFKEQRKISYYDLLMGLVDSCRDWLKARKVMVVATKEIKKDLLKAIEDGFPIENVNDEFHGVLSSANKKSTSITPDSLVIDEDSIKDEEVTGVADLVKKKETAKK